MNRTFILGHWLLTLLSGPIILVLKTYLSNFNGNNALSFLQIYPIMVIMGFMFSIPTYLFFLLIFSFIKDKNINAIYIKTFFTITIVIGIWITTNIIDGTLWSDIAISYSLSSIIIGIFLKSNFNYPFQT